MNREATIQEQLHVFKQANINDEQSINALIASAVNTIADGLAMSLQADDSVDDLCYDDHGVAIAVTYSASYDAQVQPHIVLINGIPYNAEFAVRVLACHFADTTHMHMKAYYHTAQRVA